MKYCVFVIKWFEMVNKVYEFCQTTSVKGIPRLLRTKSVFMRFVWTFSVIGFLCMAAFQAILLTMEYYEYKIYTSTGEVLLEYFDQTNGEIGTPDITLCNVNPFASNSSLIRDVPTMKEYFKLAEQATECDHNATEEECITMSYIRRDILSTSGYFDYIGRHNAKRLGHTRESFLAHCDVEIEAGVHMQRIPCLTSAHIIEIQYNILYNCYTVRLPRNVFPDRTHGGFVVVLHLDDYNAVHNEQPLLIPHDEPGQMSGVWLFAHERHRPLFTYFDRILLQPGHFHEIPVRMQVRTRLPPPHGRCLDTHSENYSMIPCYTNCFQTRIYERCGCVNWQNITSQWKPIENNGSSCTSLSFNKSELVRNWKCALEERQRGYRECGENCRHSCKMMLYDFKVH